MTDRRGGQRGADEPVTPDTPPAGTPEGYTSEEPRVSELGKKGTPGAGMTVDVPHPADAEMVGHGEPPADSAASAAHHDATTHMDAHAAISEDDHGHAEPRVGPIDWGAWAYAVLGAAIGLLVVVTFYLAGV